MARVVSLRAVPRAARAAVATLLVTALSVAAPAAAVPGSLTFLEVKKEGVSGVAGLDDVRSVAVSPDGKNVYAASDSDSAVVTFGRNATTGALSYVEADYDNANGVDGIAAALAVAVSPDGKNVYVAGNSDNAVATFSRNATTGALTFLEKDANGDGGGTVTGLAAASGVTVSPDGKHVYAVGYADDAVVTFTRDTTTGALTFLEKDTDGDGGTVDGMGGPRSVEVSPDGKQVYVGTQDEHAVVTFGRDLVTGALTFVGMVKADGGAGIAQAEALDVSPDGRNLYVAGGNYHTVTTFARDPATGALTFADLDRDGVDGVDGLNFAHGVAVSPDGRNVYVTGREDDAIATFNRDQQNGTLSFVEKHTDGVGGVDGLDFAEGVVVSPDGRNVYVTGRLDNAVAVFTREPSPAAGGGGAPPPPAAQCAGKAVTIPGTDGDDDLVGTAGRDVIAGGGGNDRIRGLGGNDLICGGAGRDTISGNRGRDRILGGGGRDIITGGPGNDRLEGGRGNDVLSGGRGDDVLQGGAGRDRLDGDAGSDRLAGGSGADRFVVGPGDDLDG